SMQPTRRRTRPATRVVLPRSALASRGCTRSVGTCSAAPGTACTSAGAGRGRARSSTLRVLRAEGLRLLRLELGRGEDALVLQVGELLQLADAVGSCGRRGRCRLLLRVRLLLLVLLGLVLLFLLFRPAIGLPARNAVRHRGGSAGDHRGARGHAEQSRHYSSSRDQASVASSDAARSASGM